MIKFPLTDWNTFADVADVTDSMTNMGLGNLWTALSVTEQEAMLYKSTAVLKATCYIRTNMTCPIMEGQIMLITLDLSNGGRFLNYIDKEQKYKRTKINKLEVEYIIKDGVELPSLVKSMLTSCLKRSNRMRGFRIA